MFSRSFGALASLALALPVLAGTYASSVINYTPGSNAANAYRNPQVALGSPERFTGEGVFPSVVSPFNPAFGSNEIVSIGAGGSLTLQFAQPVSDDANHPFGQDLLIFGGQFFIDEDYPNGVAGPLFSAAGNSRVEVSGDGQTWFTVPGAQATGLYPTLGYLDLTDPSSATPGSVLSDFSKPVDPAFDPFGKNFAQIIAGYNGSGGGTGIDIGAAGLASASYLRITNLGTEAFSIDAVSAVSPVPSPMGGLVLTGLIFGRRRRH
ncbi:MAG: hypothetical protein WC718_13955 [Phycisphaerales bacterium]|jgi:hypothetical protein